MIAVLIPSHEPGSFWELVAAGISRARESMETIGIDIVPFEYDQYDLASFEEASRKMLEAGPDGIVLAPMFRDGTLALTREIEKREIPYAFIDSKLDTEGYLAYFGLPLYKSGYLCADQLTGGQPVDSVLMVRIRRDRLQQSDPTINRRAGFMDYMLENSPECRLSNIFIDPNDPSGIEETLDAFSREHPAIRHIVMFNSRIHLIVPWLEKHPVPGRKVVGFDNLTANMEALSRGTVSSLIAQRPDEQVNLAIDAVAEYIVRKKLPPKKDNFMHMDILTRYNVEYY